MMTKYRIKIRSRHPSHNVLRRYLPKLPIRSIVRLGSTTEIKNKHKDTIEINTIDSIKISSSKLNMKLAFDSANVKTAKWFKICDLSNIEQDGLYFDSEIEEGEEEEEENNFLQYPVVIKSWYGSRGIGNYLISSFDEFNNWRRQHKNNTYIVEKYYSYLLEYRLHITKDGCFYTCRKALRKNSENDSKWRRHKDNSVWLLENNEEFFKPNSWDDIVNDCKNALKKIGADILSFDVKVQSSKNQKGEVRKYQEYILLECNSASSMQSDISDISICASKYIEILPKLITEKHKELYGK